MLLSTGLAVRSACRRGALNCSTAGIAPGYVQGNLAVLPKDLAADFLRFCQQNPKPCPVIGVSEVGDPGIPALGPDLDIRTDLPGSRDPGDSNPAPVPRRARRPDPYRSAGTHRDQGPGETRLRRFGRGEGRRV